MRNTEIIKAYKERQALVLKIVKQHQPITTKALAARVGCNIKTMSGVVGKLITAKQLTVNEGSTKRNYMVRLSKPEDMPYTPTTEQVERFKPTGNFYGIKWEPSINRPGCEDFLTYPSRIGNDRFPHRAPVCGI
jgi:hypothetical protein